MTSTINSAMNSIDDNSPKKTVLITGATSGLGWSLTKKYYQQGFKVIACGRNTEKLAKLTSEFEQLSTLAFDITNSDDVQKAANSITNAIDIVILNAGDCQYIDNVKAFDTNKFSHVINTNLISMGHMLASFLPKIPQHGQLVFISSIVTTLPFPRSHAYGASKAGLDYLANTLRLDLMAESIDVSLVHPGFVETPLTDKNDFDMPFIISADDAAQRIFSGIAKRKSYLHFPKRFTYLLKIFRFLPDALWHKMMFRSAIK